MTTLRCEVVYVGTHAQNYWVSLDEDAVVAARKCASGLSRAEDLRTRDFSQVLPCPYCGVEEDRGHDPIAHIDPRLGTPTETVEFPPRLVLVQPTPHYWTPARCEWNRYLRLLAPAERHDPGMKTVVHIDAKEACDIISQHLLAKFPGKLVKTNAVLEMVPSGIGLAETEEPSVRFESTVLEDTTQR